MKKQHRVFLSLCIVALFIGLPPPASARVRKGRLPSSSQATQAPEPPQPSEVLLERSGLASEDVSYLLFDPADGRAIEEYRADESRVPASTTKVMTAIAALKILGEDHHFQTSVLTSGEIIDGTLHGNLYLRGDGDPTPDYR